MNNKKKMTPDQRALALSLLASGEHTDAEVARLAGGFSCMYMGTLRRRVLGLPRSAAGFEILARSGRENIANARQKYASARRNFVVSRGWPLGLPLRAALVVESLCDDGPSTREAVLGRLGLPEGRYWVRCSVALKRAGLVHYLHRAGPEGKSLYFPTALAMDIRQGFLQQQQPS